jgi:hypothetical protein
MACKVFDGLFLGDAYSAAVDVNLLVANKIGAIVNCAGGELDNHWERLGIEYLTFRWLRAADESEPRAAWPLMPAACPHGGVGAAPCAACAAAAAAADMLAVPGELSNLSPEAAGEAAVALAGAERGPCVWLPQLLWFVGRALEQGRGVLVHSLDGRNRAAVCLAALLMARYGWALPRALAFLRRGRPDLLPSPALQARLEVLSQWLGRHSEPRSARRDSLDAPSHDDEALLLHNTFCNALRAAEDAPAAESDASRAAAVTATTTAARASSCARPGATYAAVLRRRSSSTSSTGSTGSSASAIVRGSAKSVRWIDAEPGCEPALLLSPFSRKPLPERPPGPSYRALHATGGWVETPDDEEWPLPAKVSLPGLVSDDSDDRDEDEDGGEDDEVRRLVAEARRPPQRQRRALVPPPQHQDNQQEQQQGKQSVLQPWLQQDEQRSQQQRQPSMPQLETKLDWNRLREHLLRNGMAESLARMPLVSAGLPNAEHAPQRQRQRRLDEDHHQRQLPPAKPARATLPHAQQPEQRAQQEQRQQHPAVAKRAGKSTRAESARAESSRAESAARQCKPPAPARALARPLAPLRRPPSAASVV